MTRQRQKDVGCGEGCSSQDGAEKREEAAKANAAYQRRMNVAAKLERYARNVESTDQQESDRGEEVDGEEVMAPQAEGEGGTSPGSSNTDGEMMSVTAQEECDIQENPTLKDVFAVVSFCKQALTTSTQQVLGVHSEVATIKKDMHKVNTRTGEVETRVGEAEDRINKLTKSEEQFKQQISEVMAKNDDLENRSRRNNIRIVGLPEKTEGRDPTEFVEKWLRDQIGADSLTKFYPQRAHRVPTQPQPPGKGPRVMIARLLHYRDGDIIIRKARECDEITMNGQWIGIYPDYSVAVQKQRMQFGGVKRRLRELGATYSMFPAKLRVVAMDKVFFFVKPEEATEWIDINAKSLQAKD
ncbi:exosome complex component RRP46 isoform X2 [Phyllobates terribilis]|uniref:exosome complex component RRP46 isoform X2 n=1 Tax=Phyllobates terribilis TaxID=111132 RepID=UPI003CCB3AB3